MNLKRWSLGLSAALTLLFTPTTLAQTPLFHSGDAIAPLQEELKTREQDYLQTFGSPDHPDLVPLLYRLAAAHRMAGLYNQPQPNQTHNPGTLNQAQLAAAEAVLERVLGIQTQDRDRFSDLDRASTFNNLAMVAWMQSNYVLAFRNLRQASHLIRQDAVAQTESQTPTWNLALVELTPQSPPPAVRIQENWASLLAVVGKSAQASQAQRQTLTLLAQLDPENLDYRRHLLRNHALAQAQQGNITHAIAAWETLMALPPPLGQEPYYSQSNRMMLGLLYQQQGNLAQTEAIYLALEREQAAANRQTYNHPPLAELYLNMGRYTEARDRFEQKLARANAQAASPSPNQLPRARLHIQLAQIERRLGNYELALQHLQTAGELQTEFATEFRRLFPDAPPNLVQDMVLLQQFAITFAVQGNFAQALDYRRQSLGVEQAHFASFLAFGAEQNRLQSLLFFTESTNQLLSWHLHSHPDNLDLGELALTTLLQRKGTVLDASADILAIARQQATPEIHAQLERLTTLRAQQSQALYQSLATVTPEEYPAYILMLNQQAGLLEHELATYRTQNQQHRESVTLADIRAQISPNAALIEFTSYQPIDLKTEQKQPERYAAYILPAQGQTRWVDLGPRADLDPKLRRWRRALQRPNRPAIAQATPLGQEIYAQLLDPILQQVNPDVDHLLMVPEGNLHLIPFEALVNEQERYVVEDYQLTYLNSGRDLLRLDQPPVATNPPLVVADPDYQVTTAVVSGESRAVSTRRALDLQSFQVGRLPGTLAEAQAIAPLLENPQVLLGAEATESAVKQVRSPQILHIATHGFFLPDPEFPAALSSLTTLSETPPTQISLSLQQEHPLLRSGLALAGFNQRQSGAEDGVLTALEISGLDLRGTQLAVFSACETGVGETPIGQGVYGLRRALAIAGAESQVISLWQVDDWATQLLMTDYYQALNAGQGRGAALRQTQLKLSRSSDYGHPYYWAAFIPSGDWRALE